MLNHISFDPSEYIKGIQQVLISDKKRVGFLFGAGSSMSNIDESFRVPGIINLTNSIFKEVVENEPKFEKALMEIKEELNDDFNIENLLSNIEQKYQIIGSGKLNSINKEEFYELNTLLKEKIRRKVSVHKNVTDENVKDLIQANFAEWIGQAHRKYGIEIFTTNYDYLIELGLEYNNIPYYDGFSGSFEPFFNPESIEDFSYLPSQTKLWKVHGSLGWHYKNKPFEKIVRKNPDDEDMLIYPSFLKYSQSQKQPYVSLVDRLCNFLKQDDSILFVCGYSFGDEHINERILSALKTNTTSHVIIFYYDENKKENENIPEYLLENSYLHKIACTQNKLSVYGMRSAVIGCKYGEWKLRTEPNASDTLNVNLYFDEDAPFNDNDEIGQEKKGEEQWTGKGRLLLPDFNVFVDFLKSIVFQSEI